MLGRRESNFLEPQAQPPVGRVCEAFGLAGDEPPSERVTSTVKSGVIVLFTDDETLLTFIGWSLVWLCGLALIAGPLAVAGHAVQHRRNETERSAGTERQADHIDAVERGLAELTACLEMPITDHQLEQQNGHEAVQCAKVQQSLGVAQFNAGHFAEAIAPLSSAHEAAPADVDVTRMLALAFFNTEAYGKAAELLQDDPGREEDPSLKRAYETDVRPIVAEARRRKGGALDPVASFRASGYRAQKTIERPSAPSSAIPTHL